MRLLLGGFLSCLRGRVLAFFFGVGAGNSLPRNSIGGQLLFNSAVISLTKDSTGLCACVLSSFSMYILN